MSTEKAKLRTDGLKLKYSIPVSYTTIENLRPENCMWSEKVIMTITGDISKPEETLKMEVGSSFVEVTYDVNRNSSDALRSKRLEFVQLIMLHFIELCDIW